VGKIMKILFMGTPEFAVPSLRLLSASEHQVVVVVTQPDKPRGRKLVLTPPPVKRYACKQRLAVLQPEGLREASFVRAVDDLSPELIVVVAYGRYLPMSLCGMARHGAINLHPSLLPQYRGAAPIQSALLNGDADTGVTVLYVSEKMDAGDIIDQERVIIRPDDDAGSLSERLAWEGARLMLKVVGAMQEGTAARVPQDEARVVMTSKFNKVDGRIDWERPAVELVRRVRAFNPWPGAYTGIVLKGQHKTLKILRAEVDETTVAPAGEIVCCNERGIVVGTGDGCLVMKSVQMEGKRAMDADAFVHGQGALDGVKLG
jgi:methionyl-tRNA formyltransferase